MSAHVFHVHDTSTGLTSSVWTLHVESPGSAMTRFLLRGMVSGGCSWLFRQWWLHRCGSWIQILLGVVMATLWLFTDFMRTHHQSSEKQGNNSLVSYAPHRFPGKSQDSSPGQAAQPALITPGLGLPTGAEQPGLGAPWQASRRNS